MSRRSGWMRSVGGPQSVGLCGAGGGGVVGCKGFGRGEGAERLNARQRGKCTRMLQLRYEEG